MTDPFEQRRRVAKHIPTFEKALFGGQRPWYLDPNETEKKVEIKPLSEEKTQTLQSLKEYATQVLKEGPVDEIKFEGGSLALKGPDKNRSHHLPFPRPLAPLLDIGPTMGESKDLVLFVGEKEKEDQKELLSRMIKAMKLNEGQFARVRLEEEEELQAKWLDDLYGTIGALRPRMVVCLGALPTNLLLGERERLSRVHGQFFNMKLSFEDGAEVPFIFSPIFHPEYLLINPKMKETVWNDLKKIMEYLGIT